MKLPRTTSSTKRIAGALLTAMIALFCIAASSTSSGCASAETIPAPDASLPPCKEGPFVFCKPVADDQPGCDTADSDAPMLTRVAKGRYPAGCVVNLVGARDEQGDCRLETVCKCAMVEVVAPMDSGTTLEPRDAGEGEGDAGEDDAGEDASPPPAPAPGSDAPRMAPVWQCYP